MQCAKFFLNSVSALCTTCLYMLCCGKIRRILSAGLNVIKMKRIPIGIRLAIQYILCYHTYFIQLLFLSIYLFLQTLSRFYSVLLIIQSYISQGIICLLIFPKHQKEIYNRTNPS